MVNSVLEGHLTFLIQALDWIPQVSVEVIAHVVNIEKKSFGLDPSGECISDCSCSECKKEKDKLRRQ